MELIWRQPKGKTFVFGRSGIIKILSLMRMRSSPVGAAYL
ncbi:Uncharacterized protein dnm_087650 [Desulfonema magnum]|uniref:Uncharacterized protein n=1 Tax=Desulfonema magnum TaxID=45655 RepID=A0A975BW07_9BACT|nr:Uncharacterized protein dnm_087650 [Desulfonema magnum]